MLALVLVALVLSACMHQPTETNAAIIATVNHEIKTELPVGSSRTAIHRFMEKHGFDDLSTSFKYGSHVVFASRVDPQPFAPVSRSWTDIKFFTDASGKLARYEIVRKTSYL